MKNTRIDVFRALIRIRSIRQERLDEARGHAAKELERREVALSEASRAVEDAQLDADNQAMLIEKLTTAGSKFQISDYLSHLDYLATLKDRVQIAESGEKSARDNVEQQVEVLKQAKLAASKNQCQCERIREKLRVTLKEIESRKMDEQDEESEEAIVARKLIAKKKRETVSDDTYA